MFTEQGIAQLSAVLRSDIAVKVSIEIMNAFVEMRKLLMGNSALLSRMDKIELKQLMYSNTENDVLKFQIVQINTI